MTIPTTKGAERDSSSLQARYAVDEDISVPSRESVVIGFRRATLPSLGDAI
jgi:hypothetical protein